MSTSADSGSEASTSFVPMPRVTFLFDKPDKLICELCKESELCLKEPLDEIDDSVPSIMPCGHIAGSRCLAEWAEVEDKNRAEKGGRKHRSCPFCRTPLKYALCRHKLYPRVIDMNSILNLPTTIPEGGSIPAQCRECRLVTNRNNNLLLLESLKPGYLKAKAGYEKTKSSKAKQALDWNLELLRNFDKVISEKLIDDMANW